MEQATPGLIPSAENICGNQTKIKRRKGKKCFYDAGSNRSNFRARNPVHFFLRAAELGKLIGVQFFIIWFVCIRDVIVAN